MRRWCALVLLVLLSVLPVPSAAAAAGVPSCSRGLVALTFDDGPRPGTTPAVLDVLARRGVRGTFFAVGAQVERFPALGRRVVAEGHRLENHSWGHERLTALSATGVRTSLRRTSEVVRRVGPAPRLYRPPYGATGPGVRAVGSALGLREVLWTVDPQDFRSSRTARQIADHVLTRLHPGAVVLLHDGVAGSARTVEALPRVIDEGRSRGFCFGVLDDAGVVRPPVPSVSVGHVSVVEPPAGAAAVIMVPVVLSVPTSRPVDVRVVTRAGTATDGSDFRPVDVVVRVPPGSRSAALRLVVLGDGTHEGDERLTVSAVSATGATVTTRAGTVVVVDRDPPPVLTEPATGQPPPVVLRLGDG